MHALYPPQAPPHRKLVFVSDLHLGIPDPASSRQREKHFCDWLTYIAPEAAAIYLLGDIWDFWFEYRLAVPKGSVRLLGTLAALADGGLPLYFMPGNHDQWLTGYLAEEIGLHILIDPYLAEHAGQRFFLSHGHRLGPLPWLDRLANAMMGSPFLQSLYRHLFHPDLGLRLGRFLSGRSRQAHHPLDEVDLGPREMLHQFVQQAVNTHTAFDWYLFAHRHLPLVRQVGPAHYVILGDWIRRYTYFEISGNVWALKTFSQYGPQTLAEGLLAVEMSVG